MGTRLSDVSNSGRSSPATTGETNPAMKTSPKKSSHSKIRFRTGDRIGFSPRGMTEILFPTDILAARHRGKRRGRGGDSKRSLYLTGKRLGARRETGPARTSCQI